MWNLGWQPFLVQPVGGAIVNAGSFFPSNDEQLTAFNSSWRYEATLFGLFHGFPTRAAATTEGSAVSVVGHHFDGQVAVLQKGGKE